MVSGREGARIHQERPERIFRRDESRVLLYVYAGAEKGPGAYE